MDAEWVQTFLNIETRDGTLVQLCIQIPLMVIRYVDFIAASITARSTEDLNNVTSRMMEHGETMWWKV